MANQFDLLRTTTRNCLEDNGTFRNDLVFEFRNAATYLTVHSLLVEYDRLRERLKKPIATHSLGTLNAEELSLLLSFRNAEEQSRGFIMSAVKAATQTAAALPRCEVVDIGIKRN